MIGLIAINTVSSETRRMGTLNNRISPETNVVNCKYQLEIKVPPRSNQDDISLNIKLENSTSTIQQDYTGTKSQQIIFKITPITIWQMKKFGLISFNETNAKSFYYGKINPNVFIYTNLYMNNKGIMPTFEGLSVSPLITVNSKMSGKVTNTNSAINFSYSIASILTPEFFELKKTCPDITQSDREGIRSPFVKS